MRNFSQLSQEEKESAKEKVLIDLVSDLCEGFMFDFLGPFADKIEAAYNESERLQTPWFMGEMVIEAIERHKLMKKVVEEYIQDIVEESFYPERNDCVIRL